MIYGSQNAIARAIAFFLLLTLFLPFAPLLKDADAQNIAEQWKTLTLDFEGPTTSETASPNPFTDYRLTVTFEKDDRKLEIPGFFAADGNAEETGATQGNVWRVRFMPDVEGQWSYRAELRTGRGVATSDQPDAGKIVELSSASGDFFVGPSPSGHLSQFRTYGRIVVDQGYFRFQDSDRFWLKSGADSPENLLAYAGFDGTRRISGEGSKGEATAGGNLHTYQPHVDDWQDGDPIWKGDQGKGLIGGINYLADSGVNAMYFLTLNIQGDGKDVWPYVDDKQFDRFDVSKLAQWEIVFAHMQNRGILMHVVTQETENERLLDDGETGPLRKLYFRELVARFGHHPGLVWNLGEENGPADFSPNGQTTEQQKTMAAYLKRIDPWQHPVLIHTHSTHEEKNEILEPLLGDPSIDGLSFQVNDPKHVHQEVLRWRKKSIEAGKPWLITMDEIGPWHTGTVPDADDPEHAVLRHQVLWGSLLAGAAGVEWYFGAKYPGNDLSLEDWRSRNAMWAITDHAIQFLSALPVPQMQPSDHLIRGQGCYCMANPGEIYVVYIPSGDQRQELDLGSSADSFSVTWFDPANGKTFADSDQNATVTSGPGHQRLKKPTPNQDWVALVKKL